MSTFDQHERLMLFGLLTVGFLHFYLKSQLVWIRSREQSAAPKPFPCKFKLATMQPVTNKTQLRCLNKCHIFVFYISHFISSRSVAGKKNQDVQGSVPWKLRGWRIFICMYRLLNMFAIHFYFYVNSVLYI